MNVTMNKQTNKLHFGKMWTYLVSAIKLIWISWLSQWNGIVTRIFTAYSITFLNMIYDENKKMNMENIFGFLRILTFGLMGCDCKQFIRWILDNKFICIRYSFIEDNVWNFTIIYNDDNLPLKYLLVFDNDLKNDNRLVYYGWASIRLI